MRQRSKKAPYDFYLLMISFPLTLFVSLIGAAGLAIGLALLEPLQNFASDVLLIIFQPFKKGHFNEAASVSGVVEEIDIFSTR